MEFNQWSSGTKQWLVVTVLIASLQLTAGAAAPTVEFHSASIVVSENQGMLLIPLKLSQGLTLGAEVAFSTEPGSAVAQEDYTFTNGVLKIDAGPYPLSTNQAVIRIPILNDGVREDLESFRVVLQSASGGLQLGTQTILEVKINDNDQGVRFEAPAEVQTFGESLLTLRVLRGDDGEGQVTVGYRTLEGTAKAELDFVAKSGSLVFEAGESHKDISIEIKPNDSLETDELFSVVLENVNGGNASSPLTQKVRILNGLSSLVNPSAVNLPFAEPGSNRQGTGIAVQGNYVYMTELDSGMSIYDVSQPLKPVKIGHQPLGNFSYGIALSGKYAYVVAAPGIVVVDVENPRVPSIVGGVNPGDALMEIAIDGNTLFGAAYGGFIILSLANPIQPVVLTNVASGGIYTPGVTVKGGYAYVSAFNAGLQIFDVRNPADPVRIGGAGLPGITRSAAISGDYAFVATDTNLLHVVSIVDPVNPVRVATLDGGSGRSIAVAGDYAYIADYNAGLHIVNISRPQSPFKVGSYSSRSLDVAVQGSKVFVADAWSGFTVIGVAPTLEPAVAVEGGFQFLLRSLKGVQVRLEKSYDLETWIPWNNVVPDREVYLITDNETQNAFYRAASE
jgi:hypothetical protein